MFPTLDLVGVLCVVGCSCVFSSCMLCCYVLLSTWVCFGHMGFYLCVSVILLRVLTPRLVRTLIAGQNPVGGDGKEEITKTKV